jgi:hypothetical protein
LYQPGVDLGKQLIDLLSPQYAHDVLESSHGIQCPADESVIQRVIQDLFFAVERRPVELSMPSLQKKMDARISYVVPNGDCCVRARVVH